MDKISIFNEVESIARRVFKDEKNLLIKPDTSASDIFSWNSLTHVLLIEEIEKRFDLTFDLDTMLSIESIDDICNALECLLKKK